MKVQLIYFTGCPHVAAARAALAAALAAEQLAHAIEEIDLHAPEVPDWAHGWGSPTILLDGVDLAGGASAAASACRLYPHGAPTVDEIRTALGTVSISASCDA